MPDNLLIDLLTRSIALEFLVQGLYTSAFSEHPDPVSAAKKWATRIPAALVHMVPKGVPPQEVNSYAAQLSTMVAEMAGRVVQAMELVEQRKQPGSPQKH